MARPGVVRGRAGRGQGVPAIRPPLGRLIPGLLGLACLASALVQTALTRGHLPHQFLFGVEGAGLAVMVAALWRRWSAWVLVAVGLVAVAEGTALSLGGSPLLAPVLGLLLLAAAELGIWSIERSTTGAESAAVLRFRALRLAAVGGVGCVVGFGLLLVADLPLRGGFELTGIGVLAAIAIPALALWLARDALRSGVRR
ncbi:MAG TPA: hypothetical protein VI138_05055 [Candidatus Dormibacteraeota bacterium]